jgi:hypothetical protein
MSLTLLLLSVFQLNPPAKPPIEAYEKLVSRQATGVFRALEWGDGATIRRYLMPEEKASLKLSDQQIDRYVSEILAPGFRRLNVRPLEMKFEPGDREAYIFAPCSLGPKQERFFLCFLARPDGQFKTTLTLLLNGVRMMETALAHGSSAERETKLMQYQRDRDIQRLGFTGIYDPYYKMVYPWKKR